MEKIYECPAFDIYKAYEGRKFKHGDKIALPFKSQRYGVLWHFFTLGTVEGYAIANGECPHEALEQHLKFAAKFNDGRERYWANANAVSISNQKRERFAVPGFEFGDVIILQGKSFRLEPTHNQNVKLVEV